MKTLAALVLVSSFAVHAAPPPIVEASPNGETSIMETAMKCPTANEKARKLYNDGKDAEDAGKMDLALKLFQQAVKADPKYCDAMDNLGLTLRRSGKIDEAVEWYRKSIAVNAKNSTSRMNLGAALRMKKAFAESAAAYSELIKVLPKDPEGYYGLATIHLDLDETAKAIAPMLMAEKLYIEQSSPYAGEVQQMIGRAYFKTEQWALAVPYLKKGVAAAPEAPTTNLELGIALMKVKKPGQAKAYLKKARELGATVPEDLATEAGL